MSQKGLLYHLLPQEATPPQEAWKGIVRAMELEESSAVNTAFSNDLLHEEDAFLSTGAPENIGDRLATFSAGPQLAALEEVPPVFIWQNIKQQLDKESVIPMRPANKSTRRIWQMAVAAACVGALVFIAPVLKNRKHNKILATNISSLVVPKTGVTDSLINASGNEGSNKIPVVFPPANTAFIEAPGVNGNMVKIPARLAPLLPFIGNEATALNKADSAQSSPQNKILKQKIIIWKAAVKAANALPAAINFADPIDLLQFLQQKK